MKWYIGQEIVAIVDHPVNKKFKKDDTFIIKGLQNSNCNCKEIEIDIGIKDNLRKGYCTRCHSIFDTYSNIWWFSEKNFAPLDYDISELTDILEKPIELINK